MRSLLMVGVLLFAVAGSAVAQDYPKGEVAGNYSYLHLDTNTGSHLDCHGGGGSGAYSLNNYLGVVGEFTGCKVTGLTSGLSAHAFSYLFGPRLTYRGYGRLEPFGEALFGGAHDSLTATNPTPPPAKITATDNAFAFAIGGGVDYKWKRNLAVRLGQFDYFYTKFGNTHQNNFRIQGGVVYRFGGR